jgi:hypothetical protein
MTDSIIEPNLPLASVIQTTPDIRPWDIGVNIPGKRDLLGHVNTLIQGDTMAAHIWCALPDGKIASTGAVGGVLYGEVEAEHYVTRRPYYILRTVDPIPEDKQKLLLLAHQQLMAAGVKRFYGFWKYPLLMALGFQNGFITKMGSVPKITIPDFPICSQAIASLYWAAGIPIGKTLGKVDWTAVLPETFLDEAQVTASLLADGLKFETRPCLKLTIVRQPF